jgi:starch-binding outer membrane protein, SusD/RagB family
MTTMRRRRPAPGTPRTRQTTMDPTLVHRAGRAARRRGAGALMGLALVVGLGACDDLLRVELPGSVAGEDLSNPALAQTLVNSALGQFECAYTSYVASAGILAHEYINASSWLNVNTWGWRGLELNEITGSCPSGRDATGLGAYAPLQQARYLAEEATRLIEGFPDAQVPAKSEMLAMLAAYAGYSYVLLGEGFCEMAIDRGPLMTPVQVLQVAEQRFTSAITHAEAAGQADVRSLAVAGRARTRLNLGNLTGAAADAAQVPEGFVWNAQYSTVNGRRENRLYNLNHRNRVLSVEPAGYADLRVGDAADPRVPVVRAGVPGHDGVTEHWFQAKYPAADSPIPMASWREAQLIIAEARPAEAEAAINRLRARQGLPAYQPSGNTLDDVLEERRRQLFSEGHRLNDMLRHDLPFPTGFNHKGQAWGPITCMPLPNQERQNNPNISS